MQRPVSGSVLFLLVLLLLVGCAPERGSGTGMAKGNQQYEAGSYDQAVDTYEQLVQAGVEEGALYYNLGNAYLKAGDLGRAILNYRRAQQLLPRDPDVSANLQLARTLTRDQLETPERDGLVQWIERVLVGWMTLEETATVALCLWVVICALGVVMILWQFSRRVLTIVMGVLGVLLLLVLISTGYRVVDVQGRTPAVVVVERSEVSSGPGPDYVVEFALHAGAEIRVVDRRNGWLRIVLPGDLQGWMPAEAVETIE